MMRTKDEGNFRNERAAKVLTAAPGKPRDFYAGKYIETQLLKISLPRGG